MFCLKKSDVLRFPDGVFPSCTTATAYFASIGFYKIFFLQRIAYFELYFTFATPIVSAFATVIRLHKQECTWGLPHASIRTCTRTHALRNTRVETRASKHARKLRTRIVRANRASTLCTQIVSANPARVSKDTEGYSCGYTCPQHRNTT